MFKKKIEMPIPQEKIDQLIKEYSLQHHVSAHEMSSIMQEFIHGFEFLGQYGKAATIYGSARLNFDSHIYQQASLLAGFLAKDGFAIITGGGPGIMEAANKGAFEAVGKSVGLNIRLDHEQVLNKYVTDSRAFSHFYVRKTMLAFASDVYIFFPGGFGTLDEFFEMVMLVQTRKIKRIPIILVDKEYWEPLLNWVKEVLFEKNRAISPDDLGIYHLVDNANEAHQLIQKLVDEKKILF